MISAFFRSGMIIAILYTEGGACTKRFSQVTQFHQRSVHEDSIEASEASNGMNSGGPDEQEYMDVNILCGYLSGRVHLDLYHVSR